MIKDNEFYNKIYNMKKRRIDTRCFLVKDDKIITIKYKNKGDKTGYYDLPGGKIEIAEDTMACAKREVKEETGLVINNLKYSGNLVIEYPKRIFDFSVFFTNEFDMDFIDTDENNTEFIRISELISKNKKFGCLKLLENEYINDILNCTNFKYHITMDEDENIISVTKE